MWPKKSVSEMLTEVVQTYNAMIKMPNKWFDGRMLANIALTGWQRALGFPRRSVSLKADWNINANLPVFLLVHH